LEVETWVSGSDEGESISRRRSATARPCASGSLSHVQHPGDRSGEDGESLGWLAESGPWLVWRDGRSTV